MSIVRQHFNVTDDFEIKIEDVDQSIETWFIVPNDWNTIVPPYPANMFNKIEVVRRDGSSSISSPHNFAVSWRQDDHADVIVRYRKVN